MKSLKPYGRHINNLLIVTSALLLSQNFNQKCQAEESKPVKFEQPKPFRFGIDYLAQPIVNPAGGTTSELSWLNGLWLQLELGFGLNRKQEEWKEIDHWVFKLETAVVRGNSNYYKQVGAAYPLQSMTSSGQWLSDLSIRREPGKSGIGVKAGIFSLNPGFMESEIFNHYVHSAINNTINNEVLAIPIAPLTSWGVQMDIQLPSANQSQQLRVGAFTVVPTNTFGQSIEPGSTPVNLNGAIGLIQWQKGLSNNQSNKNKNPRAETHSVPDVLPETGVMVGGYWSDTQSEQTLRQQQTILPDGINRGIYATSTIALPSSVTGGLHSRAWAAGHYGFDWSNNPAPVSWGVGILLQGLLPGRPLDITGIACSSTGFSPSINPGQTQESLMEINHQIHISPNLSLKPFAQVILSPSGIPSRPSILATGIQAAIQF